MSDQFDVTVKRIATARSLKVRVYPDGKVVVTAPKYVPNYSINKFLQDHRDWIVQKRSKSIQNLSNLTGSRENLFFRGKEYNFRLTVSSTKKPSAVLKSEELSVTAPSEDHQVVREVLEKWYRKEATKHFTARVPLLADLVDRDVVRVSIRSQRSRWGSCSSRNNISLNWRLIMAPDWVSDYVIYHELAHLTHMNHSDRFWGLVAEYYPTYKDAEKWLKDHHNLLQF